MNISILSSLLLGFRHFLFPLFRSFLQIIPFKRNAAFGFDLIIQRFGIMVIDKHKGLSKFQFIERIKNHVMSLSRRKGSNIQGFHKGAIGFLGICISILCYMHNKFPQFFFLKFPRMLFTKLGFKYRLNFFGDDFQDTPFFHHTISMENHIFLILFIDFP